MKSYAKLHAALLELGVYAAPSNRNGVVDAADYLLWRESRGQTGWGLAADGDLNGRIDTADYSMWRSHFGQLAGSGTVIGAAVPEPSTTIMILGALIAVAMRRSGGTNRTADPLSER